MQKNHNLERKIVWLVYDGECPICKPSANAVRIRQACGELRIINARENGKLVNELERQGYEIDDGMIVKVGDRIYQGQEAMSFLALIGTNSSLFNKLNVMIFRHKIAVRVVYPIFKFIRSVSLRIKGVPRRIH